MNAPESEPEKYYPTIYLEDSEDDYEFPNEGEMTVKFRRVNETNSTDRKGKERHSCTLEITDILDVSKKAAKEKSGGEALDELKDEYEKKD